MHMYRKICRPPTTKGFVFHSIQNKQISKCVSCILMGFIWANKCKLVLKSLKEKTESQVYWTLVIFLKFQRGIKNMTRTSEKSGVEFCRGYANERQTSFQTDPLDRSSIG